MIINGQEFAEGDRVRVRKDSLTYEGILMPSRSGNIVLKMKSGYNVGLAPDGSAVEFLEKEKAPSFRQAAHVHIKSKELPAVSILSTGGTIASRVDYRTGAVSSQYGYHFAFLDVYGNPLKHVRVAVISMYVAHLEQTHQSTPI